MGCVEPRNLVYKLRKALKEKAPEIEIHSQHGAGYWLDHNLRRTLAIQFGVELGISLCTVHAVIDNLI